MDNPDRNVIREIVREVMDAENEIIRDELDRLAEKPLDLQSRGYDINTMPVFRVELKERIDA